MILLLTKEELKNWVFQFGIANSEKMGLRIPPYAFSELGVAMLSSVLKSKTATQINIRIMRVFVELRKSITENSEYILLKETVKLIESRMDTLDSNHLVDRIQLSGKVTHLSREVQDLRQNIHTMSDLFDQFQNSHIIIKRPEEGLGAG